MTAALSAKGLNKSFGSLVVAGDIEFNLPRGERYALIGPNGAGKTTLFNCMSRLYPYQSGDILFEGRSVTNVHRVSTKAGSPNVSARWVATIEPIEKFGIITTPLASPS